MDPDIIEYQHNTVRQQIRNAIDLARNANEQQGEPNVNYGPFIRAQLSAALEYARLL